MASELAAGVEVQGLESNYLVEEQLGGGGFSHTWAAHRPSDGARVVLKVLRLDRAGELKALELFEREAAVLAGLDHPRIPRTFEFFAWDGARAYAPYEVPETPNPEAPLRWIMVQARVEGRSLRERMRNRERLRTSEVQSVLRDLLEVLDYLHGLNPPVVHRDIKPANVILDEGGRAHLVDFGAIQDRLRRASTVGSTSVGTFGYIPMEQMMGQARPASDLFALGMAMLVTATHREPEDLPIDESTAKVDLSTLALGLSATTRAALDRMLEPIVGQRAQSARECLQILDGEVQPAALRGAPADALVAAAPRTVVTRNGPPQRKYAALWKLVGGGGGLAAGLIYLVFFNSFSETELVEMSALWVAPLAFGISGHLAELKERPNPIARAVMWAGLAVGALIFFIHGIFPAL